MSQYTKSTNFATKDNLPTGDPLKIVKGTEIDTEYNNIATAIATKTDNSAAAITGGTITGVAVTSSNVTITGGSITGITDLAIADGGTGASTATAALNNLLPSQGGNANKYLQTDSTNATWDSINLGSGDITGTLAVGNGGTGITSFGTGVGIFLGSPTSSNLASAVTDETGSGALVFANSPTLVAPVLGTPTSATLTYATGLPLSTGISGLGTGVATALAINTPNIGAMVVNGGALGTPSSGTVTNLTGTASININGQVGSSTPNSGAFTTLSASSTVTVSGGTADGVAYLNGSKVLTTGSVLSFSGVHLTSNRNKDTTYSATDYTTYANGFILNNSATPATGIFNSIYFTNNANMQSVFGVVQNASGYGDFVWSGYSGSYAEWMRLTSSGLTLTSNPTLSGGTANGVTYLNGSKVLTSGSALTFNGSTLGVSAAGAQLSVTNSSGGTVASFTNSTSADLAISLTSGVSLITPSTGILALGVANTETVRLTSSSLYTASGINVGIGTTSPAYKLEVATGTSGQQSLASFRTADSTAANNAGILIFATPSSTATSRSVLLLLDADGANGSGADYFYINKAGNSGNVDLFQQSNSAMTFATNGTERARIDSSGNFGVGVTSNSFRINATVASGADRDIFAAQISGASNGLTVKWNHATSTTRVNISNLPTSSSGLASGDLWNDSGTLKIA